MYKLFNIRFSHGTSKSDCVLSRRIYRNVRHLELELAIHYMRLSQKYIDFGVNMYREIVMVPGLFVLELLTTDDV